MDELGQRERSLLLALQQEDTPGTADADRVRRRVMMAVGAAGTVGVATTATSLAAGATGAQTGAASFAGLTAGVWKAVLVVGATVGLGSGAYAVSQTGSAETSKPAALSAKNSDEPPRLGEPGIPAQQAEERDAPDAAVGELEAEPGDSSVTPDAEPAKELRPQVTRKAVPPSKPAPADSSAGTLKEEAALLSSAQQALRQGDPQGAIAALTLHKEKFPRGVLSGERQAALAVAYCQSGSLAQGREGASLFIKNNPQSPMVQRLKAACKLP